MTKRADLMKAVADSQKEIELLEKKRMRSQAALIDALISNEKPNETDVKYFKSYTALIENERENLQRLQIALDKLN